MATFYDLEIDKFYLIRVNENSAVTMVQVAMATSQCVLVYEFGEVEINYWKKKSDYLAEIVEELSDEMVDEYETLILEEFDEFDDEDAEELNVGEDDSDENENVHSSKKKKKKKKK